MSMNPEWKAKWVAALRSGEYQQSQRALKTENGYCCLGVLCDVVRKEQDEGEWKENEGKQFFVIADVSDYSLPPMPVMHLVDLQTDDPRITLNGETNDISLWNDDYGITFTELADAIEEQL